MCSTGKWVKRLVSAAFAAALLQSQVKADEPDRSTSAPRTDVTNSDGGSSHGEVDKKSQPSLAKKVLNQTVEEVYGFATGAIGEKKPLRALLKSHFKSELARRGIELFTEDKDLEQFIDLAFAAGNKFGLWWQALTDCSQLGDATLSSPQARAILARQKASKQLHSLMQEKQQELIDQLGQLEPVRKDLLNRREALDQRQEQFRQRVSNLTSTRDQLLKETEQAKQNEARVRATDLAETQALNAEVNAYNAIVNEYNNRVRETLAFLKSVVNQRANNLGTREWAAKVHNYLARNGTVNDVNWLRNSFGRDTQAINSLHSQLALRRAVFNGRLRQHREHRAAVQAQLSATSAALNARTQQFMRDQDALRQSKDALDRDYETWTKDVEELREKQVPLQNAMMAARQLMGYARKELEARH
jgi:hypothetical protein